MPARRKFLKSNSVEMRHIIDEFQRIAIAHPDVFFSLHHNGSEIFHLPEGNLRRRLIGVFGKNANKKLVKVMEDTDIISLKGFVGKPEYAKKTRGEQYFFVNDRFIKSSFLNHAVTSAYEGLLPEDTYPLYVIYIETDPKYIDVNIHPTKQEIKFEDERLVYNYLKVAVRHALGQHNIMPSLDFDTDANFARATRIEPRPQREETIRSASQQPSSSGSTGTGGEPAESSGRRAGNLKHWQDLYEGLDELDAPSQEKGKPGTTPGNEPLTLESNWHKEGPNESNQLEQSSRKEPYQVHNTYIVSQIKSGILIIDQQAAHERILYERYLEVLKKHKGPTQKQLFPRTLTLSPQDATLLKEVIDKVNLLGFDIQEFGVNTFVINGLPAELAGKKDEKEVIESLLEQYKRNIELKLDVQENIARAMARSAATKRGQPLSSIEMQALIDKLFACQIPFRSPSGRNCFITLELEGLAKRFEG